MKKVSIIIPVYNGEKYINKCLDSIFKQTSNNYEIIAIDDNSSDNSYRKLEEYKDKIKLYKVSKHDPCAVRNFGLTKCTGDLILFLDMDDTIDEKLIETISKYDDTNYDMLRFQAVMTDNNNSIVEKFITKNIGIYKGIDFLNLCAVNNEIYSPSWLYCYSRKFWNDHNFKFVEGRTQEDLGLTSYQLYKAVKVISIPFIGYNYYKSEDSIMRNTSYEKTKKKAIDVLYHANAHYEKFISGIRNPNIRKNIINYFINVLEHKKEYLNGKDKEEYDRIIKVKKKEWV